MIAPMLNRAVADLAEILPRLSVLSPSLQRLGEALLACWQRRGKVLTAGNGGSAADAMHLAEELSVRFHKNRRALAAIALCDPTVLTCAANDFGYDRVFSRQVEALGNPDDILIVLSTSGNSANLLHAVRAAQENHLLTVAFLGKDGGQLHDQCDIELLVPTHLTARIQECHKILFHTLCEWIDAKVD